MQLVSAIKQNILALEASNRKQKIKRSTKPVTFQHYRKLHDFNKFVHPFEMYFQRHTAVLNLNTA